MSVPMLAAMTTLIRQIADDAAVPSRVAFLGYPDLTDPPEAYEAAFGPGAAARLVDRANAARIREIHNRPQATVVPTIESVIALITPRPVAVEILDFQTYVGNEVIIDLNEPVRPGLKGRYGVVFDIGTAEHVFDIAQAFVNCAAMTAVGGYVVHALPMNSFNHGFWNINPTAYVDFHEDNGFETTMLSLNPWHSSELAPAPAVERFHMKTEQDINVLFIGRRREARTRFIKPIQRRYRNADTWR